MFGLDQCMIHGYGETLKLETKHSTDRYIIEYCFSTREMKTSYSSIHVLISYRKITSCISLQLPSQCKQFLTDDNFEGENKGQNSNEVPEENICDKIL